MHEFMTLKRGALSVPNSYAPYVTSYANQRTVTLPIDFIIFYGNVDILITFER